MFKLSIIEHYGKLIEYGISERTSLELDRLFFDGKMCFGDLDDRALDALKEFEVEGGVCVLRQLASDGKEKREHRETKREQEKARLTDSQAETPTDTHTQAETQTSI